MDGRDGWMDEWMNGWMDGLMARWPNQSLCTIRITDPPPRSTQGCKFTRCIPGFCVQSGDIVHNDGTGGESIYGVRGVWGGGGSLSGSVTVWVWGGG